MVRPPPSSTRTCALFPYTTLFRSQAIEHQARLNHAASCLAVDCDQPVQMLGEVDDHGAVHGLAALRGAYAARQHRHASLAGDGERCLHIDPGLRHHPAERSEEHTSELQSLMRISYAVSCLK